MPTATSKRATKKAVRKLKGQPTQQHIHVRIEPRLKVSIDIELTKISPKRSDFKLNIYDSKRKKHFQEERESEPASVLRDVFDLAYTWMNDEMCNLDQVHVTRYMDVQDQLEHHACELIPGYTPNAGDGLTTFDDWVGKLVEHIYNQGEGPLLHVPSLKVDVPELDDWFHDDVSLDEAASRLRERITEGIKQLCQMPSSEANTLAQGETIDVPLENIVEHPENVRTVYRDLEDLAESLKREGQVQECVGRRVDESEGSQLIQLLAGHRRFRAATLAELDTLRVRVIECDDVTALRIMGTENIKRDDIDAIAKGRWYQALLDASGDSHAQLAKRLEVSKADIGNHVRLLGLPETLQQRVISGEIGSKGARQLAAWRDRPKVLEGVERLLKSGPEQGGDVFTAAELGHIIAEAAEQSGRNCKHGAFYFDGKSYHNTCIPEDVLEQHRQELDIVECDRPGFQGFETEKLRIAFNTKLFDKLQVQAEADRQRTGSRSSSPSTSGRPEQSPAEKKKQQTQLQRKYSDYKVAWLHQRINEVLQLDAPMLEEERVWRLFTYFCFRMRDEDLREGVKAVKAKPKTMQHRLDVWSSIVSLDPQQQYELMVTMIRLWAAATPVEIYSNYDNGMYRVDTVKIAADLGIDFDEQWECEAAFLNLHTKDQLEQLVKEWKIAKDVDCSGKKSDTVSQICDLVAGGKSLAVPKDLKKAEVK